MAKIYVFTKSAKLMQNIWFSLFRKHYFLFRKEYRWENVSKCVPEKHHLTCYIKSSLDPSKTSKLFNLGSLTEQIIYTFIYKFIYTLSSKSVQLNVVPNWLYIFSGENQYNRLQKLLM